MPSAQYRRERYQETPSSPMERRSQDYQCKELAGLDAGVGFRDRQYGGRPRCGTLHNFKRDE